MLAAAGSPRSRRSVCTPILAEGQGFRTNPNPEEEMTKDYVITHSRWQSIDIEIRWNPDYVVYDDRTHVAHLEVESISLRRAPLPITESGYRSHFTPLEAVQTYVTPEDFVEAWLDRASRSPEWQAYEQSCKQLSLF